MAPDQGWPTLATIARELTATREQLVQAVAELRQVREQQAAQLREVGDHDDRLDRLERWRAWLAGGLSVLALLVTGLGIPLLLTTIGG